MFNTYPIDKALSPFVSFIYNMKWESKNYDNNIVETALPSGKSFMVFQCQGRFRGTIKNKELNVPKFYTIGQQTRNYTIFSDYDVIGLIGVAFKATGIYHLFRPNMSTITDTPMDSTTVTNIDLSSFEIAFEKEMQTDKKVQLIEELLLNQLKDKKFNPNFIDISVEIMDRSLGCQSISSIIDKLNVSERYFQKKFKQMVGVSPSVYNRIVRFNNLFSQYDVADKNNYKALSALFGYYDMSHFRKDFKKYCGEYPKDFHLEKFNFINEAFVKNPIFIDQLSNIS